MKNRENKHERGMEFIKQKIDEKPSGKMSVIEGSFVLLERISHKLSRQNHLLEQLVEKDLGTVVSSSPPEKKESRWKKLFG